MLNVFQKQCKFIKLMYEYKNCYLYYKNLKFGMIVMNFLKININF